MPALVCNTLIEPACRLAGRIAAHAAGSAAGDILASLGQAVLDGVRWMVTTTATWWIKTGSPDLAAEPAVTRIQQWLLPIAAAVAVGGVIAAGARMALTRKATPLLDVTAGLLTLAAAATIGVTAASLLLKAGDAWASWVLSVSTGGQFTQRLTTVFTLGGGAAPVVVIVFGAAAIVLSLAQAVLMLFRQAALIILAGVLPLAAAGAVAPLTRAWIRKVTAWMLALICYKPAAAAVYAAAFTMIGAGGSAQTFVMGFVMLGLSVLALPALLRLFTWATGAVAGSAGGGQIFGAAAAGAIAVGALRASRSGGGTWAAQDQAAYLNSRLGGSGDDGSPGGPAADPAAPSGPTGSGAGSPAARPPGSGTPGGPQTGGTVPGSPGHATWPAGAAAAAGTRPGSTAANSSTAAAAGHTAAAPAAPPTGATGASPATASPVGMGLAAGSQAAHDSARRAADAASPEDQQ